MATDSSLSRCKEQIKNLASTLKFSACGFAKVAEVEPVMRHAYRKWLSEGKHSVMSYMENYPDIRDNPKLLLDGAKTVISFAAGYYPTLRQPADAPQFAYYAYGHDYHKVVRHRLEEIASFIKETAGGECRVCVDTAPIRERYWAQQAGIGFIGRNNQLIIPGKGSYFFLGEILSTVEFPPDEPCRIKCGNCRLCADSCPTRAIPSDYSAVDARCCISCQTIESRLPLPEKVAERLGNRVYGCDTCQQVCPHNKNAVPTEIPEFEPSEEFLSLDSDSLNAMTEEKFRKIFAKSAVKRAKYTGLMRNINALHPNHK